MQQKLSKWAKSLKLCQKGANLILFALKCIVEFLLKALIPFKVIPKYWKLKEENFLPLGAVTNKISFSYLIKAQHIITPSIHNISTNQKRAF